MWINEKTLDVYRSHVEIRLAFPSVSFPPHITDKAIADFGIAPVCMVSAPVVDHTQNVSEGKPALIEGQWKQSWIISAATDKEITARVERQWAAIRADRDARLADSDWTQLPDVLVDAAAWAVYRQALRDITKQPDPFSIVWPVEPGA